MNVAMILAGGTGNRVGADIPKQFVEIMGKPVLAYTLELFENNENIDVIEIVCHKDWVDKVEEICRQYQIGKKRWICNGGSSFQESTMNGLFNLKGRIAEDDIVCISFGVSPLTPKEDINDSIRVCKEHGNGIAAANIDLCTCIKDDEFSSTRSILREDLKGFANPWSFRFGEVCAAYEEALAKNLLAEIEPHTTSLYLTLGKRLWFSQYTAVQSKITYQSDLDLFEAYLLLRQKRSGE